VSDAARRRTPRADGVRNRAALLEAGLRALTRDPEASMTDIAAEAGVTRTTLYRHFATRDAFLAAIADRVEAQVRAFIAELIDAEPPIATVFERLAENVMALLEQQLAAGGIAVGGALIVARLEDDPITPLLAVRQAAGDLRGDLPVAWMASLVRGLCTGAAREVARGRVERDDARRLLAAALADCLLPR
jgi:TetR/AcrR family transcriptional repressor of mexCD-oprJ operon